MKDFHAKKTYNFMLNYRMFIKHKSFFISNNQRFSTYKNCNDQQIIVNNSNKENKNQIIQILNQLKNSNEYLEDLKIRIKSVESVHNKGSKKWAKKSEKGPYIQNLKQIKAKKDQLNLLLSKTEYEDIHDLLNNTIQVKKTEIAIGNLMKESVQLIKEM